jgi:hypothetical protein
MPYIPSSTYESRATGAYQAGSSFIDARSRHPSSHTVTESEITKFVSPSQGTAGSTILLHIRTKYDLAAEQPTFVFMFGKKRCIAALQKVDHDDEYYNYALSVEVPPFPLTNSWDPTMMLKLQMEDKNGRFLNEIDAGNFTFTDMSPNLAYQSSPDVVRKRKYSSGQGQDYSETAAKRTNTMRFQAKPRSMSAAYSAASLSPLPTQSSLANTYGYGSGYDLGKEASYTPQLSQKSLFAVPSGMTDMKPPSMSPNLQSYSQYGSLGQSGRLSASMNTNSSRSAGLSSSGSLPTPVLVRATTLPQSNPASAGQPFNPYLMYSSKAVLKIEGNLDTMMEDWTREERDANRRLVEFKRSQHGSTISTTFAPVTPENRAARSICVSCIWWEEKDEYYITSVDTIYLLEQLVNVRFTVEEKNRIRRNLEGFRPMTVSKARPDSEEFFKVIMGFPNPKPRNIEKDVKVFTWKNLTQALKKIISKYVGSLLPPYAQHEANATTVCKLRLDCWGWLTACWLLVELRASRHLTDCRGCASQLLAAIGRQLACFDRVHSQYDLDQRISQPEVISWSGWISWPRTIGPSEESTGPGSDSMGCRRSSPGAAVHHGSSSGRARGLGLWWLSQRHYRRGCACGRAIDAAATLGRNTRPWPAPSRHFVPAVWSTYHARLVRGHRERWRIEVWSPSVDDGGRLICSVRMILRQLARLGHSVDFSHHLHGSSTPRVAQFFFVFLPTSLLSHFLPSLAFIGVDIGPFGFLVMHWIEAHAIPWADGVSVATFHHHHHRVSYR